MDFLKEFAQRANEHAETVQMGIEIGVAQAERTRQALRAIFYARDLSHDAPIPTPLLAAIEAARKYV